MRLAAHKPPSEQTREGLGVEVVEGKTARIAAVGLVGSLGRKKLPRSRLGRDSVE